MKSKILLTATLASACLYGSADAAIVEVNNGSHTNGGSALDGTAGGPYNLTINAMASDFLIVGVSTELGGTSAYGITYDGNAMTQVNLFGGDKNQNQIYILDLTTTSYTGGNATLSFTWTSTAGGDLGVGWVSIEEDSGLGAGESLAVVAQADSTSQTGSNVELVTTTDTFNFANFNHNRGANGALSANLQPGELYRNASFGSNAGAAAYHEGATAGTHNYTWAASNPRKGAAIAIGVVPEPGSLALLGIGGLLIARRRR